MLAIVLGHCIPSIFERIEAPLKKMQVLLFHTNEKWFMSLIIQMVYDKITPQFGCYNLWKYIHHINFIDKHLAICTVAIEPFDNDLQKGGKAFKVDITRCGDMDEAQKDSYKTLY